MYSSLLTLALPFGSKDIDTIDNTLPDSFRMAVSTAGSVVGAIVLIAM